MKPSRFRIWIFVFFFVSGFTGLIYEVVWTRLLTQVLGNTHYSIATVLTTFMAGLALGSYLGGRWVDRHGEPLVLYAVLEGIIGVFCFLIPYLIDLGLPLFQWIYSHFRDDYMLASLLRFGVCATILIVPASFMGATLPVLGKFVSDDEQGIGRDVGTLYAMNTFGAVVGAFASAFVFMRAFGISATIWIAAALNLTIAAIILFSVRGEGRLASLLTNEPQAESHSRAEPPSPFTPELWGVLICFGLSGVAALIYQVAWNRIFSLLLGSSVYAFSLILTTFILGLALGTVVFARLVNRFRDLKVTFGALQVAIGFSALVALPFFGDVPLFNRWVYLNWNLNFATVQWANFLIIFAIIFIPTFCMGAQFPVVVRMVAQRLETLGRNVGSAYASNTVGTIFGSFVGGFLLIPWLGIQNTILTAVILNMLLGGYLLATSPGLSLNFKTYILPGVLVLFVLGAQDIRAWDRAVISSGSYIPYRLDDLDAALGDRNKILFYEEGIHTTVTTELGRTGNIFLRVNGKTDASLAMDMRTQLLSGYLPMLFNKPREQVLVIGQGSGVTLGAVEQFPAKEIDLVEISPAVIEGSRFFEPFNHHALEDPRVNLILQDGRNHITLTDKKYDVIISEPSNPWISGIGALFTVDFFRLVEQRLNAGGIVCIWTHTNMSPENFKSIARSFHAVFPFVTVWESIVGDDYLMIGSKENYTLPYEEARRILDDPVTGKDLKRLGIEGVRDLMGLLIMRQDTLNDFIGDAPLHTDDNSLLEFGAPEYIYKDERHLIVRQLTPHFRVYPDFVSFRSLTPTEQETVRKDLAGLDRSEVQVKGIKRKAQIDQYLDQAVAAVEHGAFEQAAGFYFKILEIDPEHILTLLNLGSIYREIREYSKAEEAYRKTVQINPYYVYGFVELGRLALLRGDTQAALSALKEAQKLVPDDPETARLIDMAETQLKPAS
ncbi:fused MFS/spermidine synthase [Nitrospina sp. 32_T5]|uniref:fused MFS/spermidine synthase n=1 Tax=unclassified Nitrospina TaxID=2638683 RepID=UPI003F9DF9F6